MILRARTVLTRTLITIAALGSGCSDAPPDDAGSDEAAQTGVNPQLFRESAAWTGRLVLPTAAERQADGAVQIEIHNSPDASLKGKTVWLRFAPSADVQERARSVTRSVAFNDATRKSIAKGNVHPVRIDGWKDVAPLESLAGARKEDDVLVALPTAQRQGDSVVISREPVMIAGDYVGLVTIKAPSGNGAFKVVHYKKASGDFTGPEQTIAFDAPPIAVGGSAQAVSPVDGIEQTSANRLAGFYIHAVQAADGQLRVRALVPRHLRSLPTVNIRNGASASLLYTTAGMWDPIAEASKGRQAKGTSSSMLLVPNGNAGEARALDWEQRALDVGTRLLVTHSFGAIGPAEDGALRTGHFAFGVGTIAVEPLTDERVVDVEYKQIYAHNPNGIIAGAHDYASYTGSFARGWLYTRPLADVALHVPALDRDYTLGGASFGKPIDALARELEAMAARYRTGLGTGAAIVTPANSCVQDSSKALYFALAKLEEKAAQPDVKAFLAAHPNDPEVQDFGVLVRLGDKVERYLSPLGFTRADWRNQVNKLGATDVNACPGGIVGAAFCGLASFGTVTPRRASDFYTEALILEGAGGVAIRSNDLGGAPRETFPLSPTTLFR
jgi:predicted Abi (CAAX) family protease